MGVGSEEKPQDGSQRAGFTLSWVTRAEHSSQSTEALPTHQVKQYGAMVSMRVNGSCFEFLHYVNSQIIGGRGCLAHSLLEPASLASAYQYYILRIGQRKVMEKRKENRRAILLCSLQLQQSKRQKKKGQSVGVNIYSVKEQKPIAVSKRHWARS